MTKYELLTTYRVVHPDGFEFRIIDGDVGEVKIQYLERDTKGKEKIEEFGPGIFENAIRLLGEALLKKADELDAEENKS